MCLSYSLQDPADGGAVARPHLHRRRVFQRGANRLWQRPEVSEAGQCNQTQTRAGARCAANGLQNNGCTLLMLFIIAIKLQLAYFIGGDIMQNENESIRYRSDVNSVMETCLCAEAALRPCSGPPEPLCSRWDRSVCLFSVSLPRWIAHLLCALTYSCLCKVKKVNQREGPFRVGGVDDKAAAEPARNGT